MARKLKSYRTSLGFFDLAIAAPSMKAAAEAWGSKTEDFRRGFANQTDDSAIVAATMAKPGVVLKRPVGSNGPFTEHAELPKDLPIDKVKERPAKPRPKTIELLARKVDDKAAREAALAYEREQKRREIARQKEEAAQAKKRKKREQEIAKAQRALEEAKRHHETKAKVRTRACRTRQTVASGGGALGEPEGATGDRFAPGTRLAIHCYGVDDDSCWRPPSYRITTSLVT